MRGYGKGPGGPKAFAQAIDPTIHQASTLGQLEALAGIGPEARDEFWLRFVGIEDEAQRLATGIAELRRRIKDGGLMV